MGAETATLTITHYKLPWYWKHTSPAGGTCSASAVPAGTSTASPTGLDTATSHTFAAYADGACSTLLATAPAFLTRPGRVSGVALAPSSNRIAVSWAAETGTVTGYRVQWKSGDDPYNTGDRQKTVTGGTSASTEITGLTDGKVWTVRVTAYNATGAGAASAEATATPSAATLTAGTATATGMTLTIAGHNAAWYHGYTTPSGDDCSAEAVQAGTPSKAVTGLDSNTAYTFKAYGDSGCSTVLAAAAAPVATLPPKPAKPAATTGAGSGKLTLESSVTGTAPLTKWQYKKKKDGDAWDDDWTDVSGTSKTLSHTVSGLTDGSAYRFKVRARNASGFGAESDESDESAAATPRAPALSAGTATATGMTLTVADWSEAWRWKRTAPTAGDCSTEVAAGTKTATVTDLESNTAWTFKAYSDGNCQTELAAASPFATLPPKPGEAGGHRR